MRFSTATLIPVAILVVLGLLLAGGYDAGNRLAAQEKNAGKESADSGKPKTETEKKAGEAGTETSSEEKPAEEEEFVAPPPPPPRKPRIPIQELQYRVEIALVFEQDVHLGATFRQSVRDELDELADQSFGAIWDYTVYEPTWLTPRNHHGVAGVSDADIKWRNQVFSAAESLADLVSQHTEGKVEIDVPVPLPTELVKPVAEIVAIPNEVEFDEKRKKLLSALVVQMTDGKVKGEEADLIAELMTLYVLPAPQRMDKVFPVSVEKQGSYYQVTAREWDRDSEGLSPVRSRRTLDRRGVAEEIINLLADVYHPIGQIDEADPVKARIKMRAGLFSAGNPAFDHVTDETIFKPFFRYLDESQVLKQLQVLPWSYLTIEDILRERISCKVTSGVSTPLGAFRRRRMEIRAISMKPDLKQTTLRLAPKRNHDKPLVGYLVAVYDELPPPPLKPGEEPPEDAPPRPVPEIHRSDRFGRVHIPVDPKNSLEWVLIRSGSALLTKFPFVPGAEPEMLVECPDDTIRLNVEGQLVLLQGRLIDTIAKRSVVMAMIKNRSKKQEWDKVDESLKQLKSLPTLKQFTDQVETIQFAPRERARERNDRTTVSRINKLGSQVLKVAAIHLDTEKLDAFLEEIRELREIDDAGGDARGRRTAPSAN